MRVLVVEDERKVAGFLRAGLEEQGFVVEVSHHGDEALARLQAEPWDAAVLDVMLPGMDGMEICGKLRGENIQTPILMLIAKSE